MYVLKWAGKNVFVYKKHQSVMLYEIKEQSKYAVKKKEAKIVQIVPTINTLHIFYLNAVTSEYCGLS